MVCKKLTCVQLSKKTSPLHIHTHTHRLSGSELHQSCPREWWPSCHYRGYQSTHCQHTFYHRKLHWDIPRETACSPTGEARERCGWYWRMVSSQYTWRVHILSQQPVGGGAMDGASRLHRRLTRSQQRWSTGNECCVPVCFSDFKFPTTFKQIHASPCVLSWIHVHCRLPYIVSNFRGPIISWISRILTKPRKMHVQHTKVGLPKLSKILYVKFTEMANPRKYWPSKMTRYTVFELSPRSRQKMLLTFDW